ncbi:MAG: DUF4918 family protein [Saprospiraceae bacterium]|nr:DUF4918 family protein [Saprospiraceae bacterium]
MVEQSAARNILLYHQQLTYDKPLPEGIKLLNPYRESETVRDIAESFYHRFYNDDHPRQLILGINPGRLGAGATGIPFTDSKRLIENCGLPDPGFTTYEPSSVFIYDMIKAFGGASSFYQRFYINSVFPLALVLEKNNGKFVNYNYYDDVNLQKSLTPFIIQHIRKQQSFVKKTDVIFCLGRGKNFAFLNQLNKIHGFVNQIVPLEHPRFIMQYKLKTKDQYIDQYLETFSRYS